MNKGDRVMLKNEKWWKNSVIYQIYPKSFQDTNGDGIGDIQGIIQRLPYLQNLGIDAIWLSPVYQSPQKDNGYDISDYQNIDPMFGTMDDIKQLFHEAEQKGIKIIMDLVLNHTSDQHRWFQEAKKSKDNPYHDYYIWKDGAEGIAPNDMKAVFGGSAWEWVPELKQYYFHQFAPEQPDLNWENPSVRRELYQMILWWMDLGAGGFRLDVIDQIAKEPDRQITCNGPKLHEFIRELSKETFQKGNLITVGEAWGATPETAKLYSAPDGSEFSMVFRVQSAKMLATVLHGMQGTPYIYQGEELGMTNVKFSDIKDYRDLETIQMFERRVNEGVAYDEIMNSIYEKSRDNARTPMQWNGQKNVGFTDGIPWIQVNENYKYINVQSEEQDKQSVLNYYKRLIALRKSETVLTEGKFELLMEESEQLFVYTRQSEEVELLICANFTKDRAVCRLMNEWKDADVLLHNYESKISDNLNPYEAFILKRKL